MMIEDLLKTSGYVSYEELAKLQIKPTLKHKMLLLDSFCLQEYFTYLDDFFSSPISIAKHDVKIGKPPILTAMVFEYAVKIQEDIKIAYLAVFYSEGTPLRDLCVEHGFLYHSKRKLYVKKIKFKRETEEKDILQSFESFFLNVAKLCHLIISRKEQKKYYNYHAMQTKK